MAITLIFIFASFIRLYQLDHFPLNIDEPRWFFLPDNFNTFFGIPAACHKGSVQPFFGYLVFFTRKIFFSPEFVVRIPSVIIGSATVVLVYFLAKEMYGRKVGLISTLLLTFLPWHIIQSRIGVSLILTPFFSCLIFLSLLKAIHKQSGLYFLLSCFLLGIGSFYTYQNSVLLIPIFIFILIILRKDLYWLKPQAVLLSMLIFLIVVYPLSYLQSTGKIHLLANFYRHYQESPFQGNIFLNIIRNLSNITPVAFKVLFFNSSREGILFADAFRYPLLISGLTLIAVIFSIIISLRRRSVSDRIILAWFILGLLGSCGGMSFFRPHYIIILMPVLVIFIARFVGSISNYAPNRFLLKRKLIFVEGFFCAGLVFTGVLQWVHYHKNAPIYVGECSNNSYGCKEVAYYLSRIPNIKDYGVIVQGGMSPVYSYLSRFAGLDIYDLRRMMKEDAKRKKSFRIIWASESDPQETPVKIIYYPNGLEAIHIFFEAEGILQEKISDTVK